MADPTPPRDLFSTQAPEKRSRLPWVLAGVVILVIVGAVLLTGRKAAAPVISPNGIAATDPYASSLPVSHIQMSQASSMVGAQATYIDGQIANRGNKTVTGVMVQVVFRDFNNQVIQTDLLPISRIRTREPYVDTEPVSAAPIEPGQTAEFRLILDQVKDEWNQNYPEIRVVRVTFR
jgi:Protein of unknown function (DUF2393)